MSKKPHKKTVRSAKRDEPERIDLSLDEKQRLIDRINSGKLSESDRKLLVDLLNAIHWLNEMLSKKALSVRRLMRLFGFKSEKAKNLFGPSPDKEPSDTAKNDQPSDKDSPDAPTPDSGGGKPGGHGKSSASDFPGAKRVVHEHDELKKGDRCPSCHNGNLVSLEPGRMLRFYGRPPLDAVVHEYERLRCSTCGEVFKAELPKDIPKDRANEEAKALVCLLRYQGGFPHYRLAKFQKALGAPLPESTQWGMVEAVAGPAYRVWQKLIEEASQLTLFHNDDTGMRIQDLRRALAASDDPKKRTGIYTTGIVAKGDGKDIALFFTKNRHAGENLSRVLANRSESLSTPLQMCDALSRNPAKGFETILCHCMDHARRAFIDVKEDFPEDVEYVIRAIGLVYKNDKTTKTFAMDAKTRRDFHQIYSLPILNDLKVWAQEKLDARLVEPNSGLGDAINYFLNHFQKLTAFCHHPAAPLSNAEVERLLKTSIIHRKNSLHYKTEIGALVGDVMMSLIQTCVRMSVNPFDYLVALQKHCKAVFECPENWLPWNYQATLT